MDNERGETTDYTDFFIFFLFKAGKSILFGYHWQEKVKELPNPAWNFG
jgi:hypothetical protein